MLAIKVLIRLGHRLRFALLILVTWVGTATTGYRVIEGWSWFDSFYMTIITIFTIGYQEVHPLTIGGRIWSIVVIGAGFPHRRLGRGRAGEWSPGTSCGERTNWSENSVICTITTSSVDWAG